LRETDNASTRAAPVAVAMHVSAVSLAWPRVLARNGVCSTARRILSSVMLFWLYLEAGPGGALCAAQAVTIVRECNTCRLSASRVLRIGDTDGPGTIDSESVFAHVDSRGNYLLHAGSATSIRVYTPNGGYLRTVGRRGDGPGEFRAITALALSADSVFVLDFNGRMTVFSPDHALIRTSPLGFIPTYMFLALGSGRFVMGGGVRTPERVGYPAHLMDSQARIIRSFGSRTAELRPDIQFMDVRALSRSGRPDAIWLAYRNKYEIELWDPDGTHLSTLVRRVDWFEDWFLPGVSGIDPSTGPRPRISAIREDEGILWVALTVADRNWREVYDPGTRHVSDELRFFDTVIEGIDLRTSEVVGSVRFDNEVLRSLGGGRVGGVEYDDAGEPRFVVWQLQVTRD
jgi:hypothetical protein